LPLITVSAALNTFLKVRWRPGRSSVFTAQHEVLPSASTAGFTYNLPVVVGTLSVFTNTTTGGGTIGYQWNFGDGSPISNETHPTHLYAGVNAYTVILTATSDGGTDVFSGIHNVIEESDFEIYLPLLMNANSSFDARVSGKVMVPSCRSETNQIFAFFGGLAELLGISLPEGAICSSGAVAFSSWSLPWLLLLGTTFIFRRRKRSFCGRNRSFCGRNRSFCGRKHS
jgi:hypothetical protein